MKKYFIPISWEEEDVLTVQAETLEEAMKIAENTQLNILDGDYVEGSLRIDPEKVSLWNK